MAIGALKHQYIGLLVCLVSACSQSPLPVAHEFSRLRSPEQRQVAVDPWGGIDSDEAVRRLLDWAEAIFPANLPFPPTTSGSWGAFDFRCYLSTDTCVGVVVRSNPAFALGGVYLARLSDPAGSLQSMGSISAYHPSVLGYGTTLGEFNGVAIKTGNCIRSGPDCGPWGGDNFANADSYNTGPRWSSSEFVNRYYLQVYGARIRLPVVEPKDYLATGSQRGLLVFENGGPFLPKQGDILVAGSPTTPGHVAIVREVSQSLLVVAQQAWTHSATDVASQLTLTQTATGYVVGAFSPGYEVIGWLRHPVHAMNDTGVTSCSFSWGVGICAGSSGQFAGKPLPRQDALVGRDALAAAGALPKRGVGRAGFDFTKLDAMGNDLPQDAAAWSCVRDNVTGLVWELKTQDGGLRDRRWIYSWYETDPKKNGGVAGFPEPRSLRPNGQPFNPNTGTATWCGGTLAKCNTESYAAAVNADRLCGYSDWRLPSFTESIEIADFGSGFMFFQTSLIPDASGLSYPLNGADPNPIAFTDTATGQPFYRSKWTSTVDPVISASRGMGARAYQMSGDGHGEVPVDFKDGAAGIRLVRGGSVRPYGTQAVRSWVRGANGSYCEPFIPPVAPDSRYILGTDSTVLDKVTGLQWKQCLEGQTGAVCSGSPIVYKSSEANDLAVQSTFAGKSDWRIPTSKELQSLYEPACEGPPLNGNIFPGAYSYSEIQGIWSSSHGIDGQSSQMVVPFGVWMGDPIVPHQDQGHVRLVRTP